MVEAYLFIPVCDFFPLKTNYNYIYNMLLNNFGLCQGWLINVFLRVQKIIFTQKNVYKSPFNCATDYNSVTSLVQASGVIVD